MADTDGGPASIFRKKSLDRVSSPDQLDQYIRVSSPGAWMVLIAIVLLALAAVIWLFLGRVPSTQPATITVENGQITGQVEGVSDGTYQAEITVSSDSPSALFLGR